MGLWKFRDRVSVEDLCSLAERWAAEDPSYLQLYVRKVSKDQYGIGFAYQLPADKPGHSEYFERVSDQLKKLFGNDLVGWDIASPVRVIK